ncbi:MAG: sugar ABC transporter ATP-binding protein [Treponema sp.]|jgi:inositol transport system ATP-binding protein|nr:sugar ABC transporter ATP-binding protein [Treponema sp.]
MALQNKETYVLEMVKISKEFPGVKALNDVNLKVRPGKVHVICGENGAGKSTLMKVLNGSYTADSGDIFYNGKKVELKNIQGFLDMGIAMIYQELNPVMEMTIGENIFLGREPHHGAFVDFKKMYLDTQVLLDRMHIDHDAKKKMKYLNIAGHQLIEIAKAISRDARVIIMDEPTSAISDTDVKILFQQIGILKSHNVAIIYITHKMDEIFKIADDITILRDGKWVESGLASNYTPQKLVTLMVGREIANIFPKDKNVPIGDVVLAVENLTQSEENGGRFKDICFELRAGEILGFAGLVGAGRTEVMRSVFGLDPYSTGKIILNGKSITIKSPLDAIKQGIAMISEDRRLYGLVVGRSAHENISLVNIRKYKKHLFVNDRAISIDAEKMKKMLNIKISGFKVKAEILSGGNQQKLVLSKWLVGDVKILIMDEPTRGIDVGAKAEIHKLMVDFARQGMAIIMISSELPEIIGMSDRVVVMQEGRINGILSREETTQETIMNLATHGKTYT